MVKQCNVILNNEAVTVVRFGDVSVQLPAIGMDAKQIWVAHENGKYFRVDAEYGQKEVKAETLVQPKKRAIKKTTVEEVLTGNEPEMPNEG